VARSERPVHAVTELVDESLLLQPKEFAGHFDPHLWMDVAGWMQAVNAVTDGLADFDPAASSGYAERATDYAATLTELHDYARRALGSIPEQQRILVTAHDAFNYFGRAYGLEVAGIQGMSTESEAGLDRINRLVELLVTRRIRAVFVETTIAERNVRALIEGAAARGHTVVVGGELFSDAMGQPGTYEGTYVGMLDHNVTTVARALGGEVPERGFQGLLSHAGETR
jgi:manganese/zinc/iron transport system substrate-binding protein